MSETQAALARLLQALPFWSQPAARSAFLSDLRQRLEADPTSGGAGRGSGPTTPTDRIPVGLIPSNRMPSDTMPADTMPFDDAGELAAHLAAETALPALLDAIVLALVRDPAAAWPLAARWADGASDARHLAAQVQTEALAWARQGWPKTGCWPHELLQPARELLHRGGLLTGLEQTPALADFLTPEVERLLAELDCHTTDNGRREDIGLRLAAIGDPRPGVLPRAGCPQPAWQAVPAGTVLIDGRREVAVASFHLAAYPVTEAQFAVFLTATDGFRNPAWWHGLRQHPLEHCRGVRRGNYPVTGVSWYDATAFCRWLSSRLAARVRLPDEAEWQWAAHSARANYLYPWGADWLDAHANTDETGIGRTIAVGMYPAGTTAQGVADLAGNTWEWCRDSVAGGPGTLASRIIRGGSWRVNRGFARADFRLDASPDDRVGSTGFRLVRED